MKFTTHLAKSNFGIIIEAFDMQKDEFIIFVLILFGRAFKVEFMPLRRLVKHFEFRLPPIQYIERDGKCEKHKTKVLNYSE